MNRIAYGVIAILAVYGIVSCVGIYETLHHKPTPPAGAATGQTTNGFLCPTDGNGITTGECVPGHVDLPPVSATPTNAATSTAPKHKKVAAVSELITSINGTQPVILDSSHILNMNGGDIHGCGWGTTYDSAAKECFISIQFEWPAPATCEPVESNQTMKCWYKPESEGK